MPGAGKGDGELLVNGDRVSVLQDGKALGSVSQQYEHNTAKLSKKWVRWKYLLCVLYRNKKKKAGKNG